VETKDSPTAHSTALAPEPDERRFPYLLETYRLKGRKEAPVSSTVLYMSMSLDGFIAGPNEGPGNGLGDGGPFLHEWVFTGADADHERVRRPGGVNGQVFD
jgi:hypothetical protein